MDSFNALQVTSSIRATLIAVGGLAAGFGLATKEQVAALTDPGLWAGIGGAIIAIGGIISAIRARSTKAVVADVSKLPDVKTIVASSALANALQQRPNVVASIPEAEAALARGA